ncbi:putative short-chain dehydrogenase/reductase family 42E member 2 isoform X2 [Puntigrus tetrazona]|uniref:putative short-chain dehydrogenase/reductase family 42E member 2 isoform X2 n=1 Tax=Puntigrus tetrazona TaxID=1606681 RepID=UPI001C8A7160|nr:putative short-chain dehydrogenase/reductase family 42E member 2 isoform X2 [Puntigrus tetrazona]
MKENRSSCQVEQLPCACLLDCHRPTHTRGAAGAPPRHRANGAVGASCNSPNCVVAARLEDPERGRHGAGRVLVTGGAGYFGFRLGRALAGQGATVLLLDLHKPPWDLPDGAVFQQLRRKMIESVNVGGTNNIINVCTERGISRLIYTSTVNVAFAGRPIEDGDEDSVPCVQLDMHIDHYSRTKAIAERMVLAANRRSTKGGALLHTCVLRPSGIYGPEERRHLHRVMVNVERRLFSFRFGDPNAKMNWVHVDNLVTAHVLAAEALTADKAYVASGQVYFINDGESVNVFEWLTPLFERLGYGRPLIHLPVSLVYSAAILMERLHVALSPIMEIPLLLTRNEVRNIAVSHTFKIEKAQRELGFSPERYSLKDSVDQYLRSRPPRSAASLLNTRFLFLLLLLLLTGVIALTICRQ